MSTKGASNHFGNSRHGRKGHITMHTGFAWAKDFERSTLYEHYDSHGRIYGVNGYIAKAVTFANRVDRVNHISYVRKDGTTVKYSKKTNEFVVVDKFGFIRTYYFPKKGIEEYYKDRRRHR